MQRRNFIATAGAGLIGTIELTGNLSAQVAARSAAFDWISQAKQYQLPDWFESQRIHLHTRLTRSEAKLGTKVAKSVKQMGAEVFTRHVKSGDYGPFWPTKVGKPYALAAERNFVAEMIEDAHSEGIRILGYYWITTDLAAAEEHPQWLCRDSSGQTIDAARHGNSKGVACLFGN